MKKKMLFLTHEKFYPVTIGGTILNYEIANAFVNKGYEVHVFSPISQKHSKELKTKGMILHGFEFMAPERHERSGLRELKYALYSIIAFPYLFILFLKYRFELAFVRNFILAIPIIGLTRIFNAKFFLSYTNILCAAVESKNFLVKAILNISEKIEIGVAKYSDQCFVVTKRMKDEFLKNGVPSKKITISYDGVDLNLFKSAGVKEKNSLLYVGSIEYYQGLDILLKAFGKVLKQFPGFQMDIIGVGRYTSEISRSLGSSKNKKRVNLIGFVPHEKIVNRISSAKICVIPYRKNIFTDTIITLKLLEYGALKKPVVCPRLDGLVENFNNKEVMFFEPENYLDLENKITALIKNAKLRNELGRNLNAKIMRKFTIEKFIDRFFDKIH